MLEELEQLERELHQTSTRSDASRLAELLHPDFREFGKNGRDYRFREILEELFGEDGDLRVWSGSYTLQHTTKDSALILYKSAHIEVDGSLSKLNQFNNRRRNAVEKPRLLMAFAGMAGASIRSWFQRGRNE